MQTAERIDALDVRSCAIATVFQSRCSRESCSRFACALAQTSYPSHPRARTILCAERPRAPFSRTTPLPGHERAACCVRSSQTAMCLFYSRSPPALEAVGRTTLRGIKVSST